MPFLLIKELVVEEIGAEKSFFMLVKRGIILKFKRKK
jgi:hypothetical protein